MERSSTPTNELIIEAATLYVMLLSQLQIQAAVFATHGVKRRPVVFIAAPVCDAVEDAARFWDEKITTPLIAAHDAMHNLTTVSLHRATTDYPANGPFAVAMRCEVKRLRHVIAEAEAKVRREIAETEKVIAAGLVSEVLDFLKRH